MTARSDFGRRATYRREWGVLGRSCDLGIGPAGLVLAARIEERVEILLGPRLLLRMSENTSAPT